MSIIEKALDKLGQVLQEGNDSAEKKAGTAATALSVEDKLSGLEPSGLKDSQESEKGEAKPVPPPKGSRVIQLNLPALSKAGYLVPNSMNKRLVEEYRRIKRPLLTRAFAGGQPSPMQNLVVVTSAMQGEGKSFTSLNLAMSVASEMDRTALLIDADVFKQSLTRELRLEGELGLTDFLLDKNVDLADCLLRTNVPNLTLLPSGKTHQKVTELWASDRMREFVTELSQRYEDRLIVFDSPPLLQESSAAVLASLAGQVIMVVEAERTKQHIVKEALANLPDPGKVGLVLNKSNLRFGTETNYYGYY